MSLRVGGAHLVHTKSPAVTPHHNPKLPPPPVVWAPPLTSDPAQTGDSLMCSVSHTHTPAVISCVCAVFPARHVITSGGVRCPPVCLP